MITVYSNDNAVATDRMCGVRSCAKYSIIFPLLLCTENILLDKKAFKSVYKLIILPWYRRCTWPAAWQCSGQQAAGTRHHRTASRYWYQSGGGAGRGNTSNTFIL